jgi:hypothetical protein
MNELRNSGEGVSRKLLNKTKGTGKLNYLCALSKKKNRALRNAEMPVLNEEQDYDLNLFCDPVLGSFRKEMRKMNTDRFLSFSAAERDWIARALVSLAIEILNRTRSKSNDPPVQELISLAHEADGKLMLPQRPRESE